MKATTIPAGNNRFEASGIGIGTISATSTSPA